MIRSLLVPGILTCIIALPFLLPASNSDHANHGLDSGHAHQAGFDGSNNPMALPSAQRYDGSAASDPFYQANSTVNFQNAPLGNPVFSNRSYSRSPQNPAAVFSTSTQSATVIESPSSPAWTNSNSRGSIATNSGHVFQQDVTGMTPDFGAAQTIILPGNELGPNLNAQPLEFMPVSSFEEFLRFNITPEWVRKRWKRISTSPAERGLHGFRVALVTGTHSWDLHGSLTYFFDASHRLQRITFRGWAGDATKLTNLLTLKYGFRPRQTHWAGFYIAEFNRKTTGGLLMQHPAVIYSENPVQQVAVVLEINNPNDKFTLSDDFQSLIEGSMVTK